MIEYGHLTIHKTPHLDIEVDDNGIIVAVWFRCMPLPFKQHKVTDERAQGLRQMYDDGKIKSLHSVIMEQE